MSNLPIQVRLLPRLFDRQRYKALARVGFVLYLSPKYQIFNEKESCGNSSISYLVLQPQSFSLVPFLIVTFSYEDCLPHKSGPRLNAMAVCDCITYDIKVVIHENLSHDLSAYPESRTSSCSSK